jgi:hypothetical protein
MLFFQTEPFSVYCERAKHLQSFYPIAVLPITEFKRLIGLFGQENADAALGVAPGTPDSHHAGLELQKCIETNENPMLHGKKVHLGQATYARSLFVAVPTLQRVTGMPFICLC